MDARERARQHRPYDDLDVGIVSAVRVAADDSRIIDRIVAAYRRSAGRATAEGYLPWTARNARRFWSVNHEVNAFTVGELLRAFPTARVERFPYWMRNGYVEEIASF